MAAEIEIKFLMESPAGGLERLLSAGAAPRNERTFEDNAVLDDHSLTLMQRGVLMRLRRYGDIVAFTVKSNPEVRGGLKVREEREVLISDFNTMLDVLNALGYHPIFRYQKYRRNFDLEGTVASLDETPIGCFLELEGEPEAIRAAAQKLGLGMGHGLTQSYMELFRAIKPSGDMVFQKDEG